MIDSSSAANSRVRQSQFALWALLVSILGGVLLVALWAVMWLPVYVSGDQGLLFLFPLFLLAAFGVSIVGLVGAALSIVSLVRSGGSARGVIALILGSMLVFFSLPVVWFGNVFVAYP